MWRLALSNCVCSELPFADISLPDNTRLSVVDTSFGLEDERSVLYSEITILGSWRRRLGFVNTSGSLRGIEEGW